MKNTFRLFLNRSVITMCLLGMMVLDSRAQQAPQFTQFMFNNLVINPAYAGADEAISLTLVNRNQWSGVEKAPSTQSFSAHSLVKKKHIGLGLTVVRDQIGVHKNTTTHLNYAYHLKLRDQSFLSMGILTGVTTLKSDYASLLGTGNDPKLFNSVNETEIDFGSGIYFRSPKWDIGLSAPQMLSKTLHVNDTVSIGMSGFNLLGYSRYRIALSETLEMVPGVMVKYYPALPISYDIYCGLVYRNVLTGGLSYRRNESIDLILRFQVIPQLQLGYAYDYPISQVAVVGSPSHEIMIQYLFRNVHKHVDSPR